METRLKMPFHGALHDTLQAVQLCLQWLDTHTTNQAQNAATHMHAHGKNNAQTGVANARATTAAAAAAHCNDGAVHHVI